MDEKIFKKIISKMQCGGCGQYCEPDNVHVMGHRNDVWIISVYCPSCNSAGLVTAVVKASKKSEVSEESKVPEVVTELTEPEIRKFSTPISSDDVLDMHMFLNDLTDVFPSNKSPKQSQCEELRET